jgi:hypothetical protein
MRKPPAETECKSGRPLTHAAHDASGFAILDRSQRLGMGPGGWGLGGDWGLGAGAPDSQTPPRAPRPQPPEAGTGRTFRGEVRWSCNS